MTPAQCLARAKDCEARASRASQELAVTLRLVAAQWRVLALYPTDDNATSPREVQIAFNSVSGRT